MLQPKKSLGQNFLQDPNLIHKIVGTLDAPRSAPVVEIGPGLGALTEPLQQRFDHVTALEVDERMVTHLRQARPDLDVRHTDVLDVDWAALREEHGGERLHVIGNLPYYITTPILFGLLDARAHLAEAVLMMQLEVAQRLVAGPGSKTYGGPSVLVQLLSEPRLAFKVSKHVFFPKPDVTSAIVHLRFREDADPTRGVPVEHVREVVRTAFNQRRKMLRNSLSALADRDGAVLPERWSTRRPEKLSPKDFVELARALYTTSG